jgi:hypothetical protein
VTLAAFWQSFLGTTVFLLQQLNNYLAFQTFGFERT